MYKTKKLNQLFKKWNDKSYKVFMKDGIVCEEHYEDIMFVLKDVNNANPDDVNDMRIDVQTSENGGKTWFDVASWTSALLDGVLIENVTHEIQHEQLKRVAIMNLKKEAGTSRADYKELKEAARRDHKNILKEIEICAPKLIVACSHDVFNILCSVIFDINKFEYCNKICFTERMYEYGLYCDISKIIGADSPVYLLEYRHPSQCGRQGTREEHYKNMMRIRKVLLTN